jgi:formiminotetrahydrofolate cyclodeaminase
MTVNLLTLPLEEVLRKFASGGHKPGSGSAAALAGLISCALTETVIGLTKDRNGYKRAWAKLDDIAASIANDIKPALLAAFHNDADQFDKVILSRRARDNEREPVLRWKHARRAQDDLYEASEIPVLIAEKCLLLAEHAIAVFDIGFKSARGDSEVAIDSALSGTTGAISIVYLNLSSFTGNRRAATLLGRATKLGERASYLKSELQKRIQELKIAAENANRKFGLDLKMIRHPRMITSRYRDSEIEGIAKNVQNELWTSRVEIWPDGEALNHIGALDAPAAFRALGYDFETSASLGRFKDGAGLVEVAGYINKPNRYAAVSKKFLPVVQRFTAAHELGHAVLHAEDTQFRDRALDGAVVGERRSQLEYEADKFATYFLMPEPQIRDVFKGIFGSQSFVINNNTAFALGAKNSGQLLRECPSIRSLSQRLAKTRMFASRPVRSIAEIFGVSIGAMAIRIEELRMIDPNGHSLL